MKKAPIHSKPEVNSFDLKEAAEMLRCGMAISRQCFGILYMTPGICGGTLSQEQGKSLAKDHDALYQRYLKAYNDLCDFIKTLPEEKNGTPSS